MIPGIIGISGKIGSGKDTVGKILQYLSLPNAQFAKGNQCILDDISYGGGYVAMKSHWQIKKFADKLKDIVCLLIGCTRQQLEDHEFKNKTLGKEWDKWYLEELWFNAEDMQNVTDLYFNTEEELDEYVVEFNHTYNTHNKVGLVSLTPRTLLQLLGTECGRNIIHPNIWVNALMQEYEISDDKCCGDFEFCMNADGANCTKDLYPNWIITDVRFPNEAQAIKDRGGIIIRVERPNLDSNKHQSETALDNWKFDHVINNNGTINNLIDSVKSLNLQL